MSNLFFKNHSIKFEKAQLHVLFIVVCFTLNACTPDSGTFNEVTQNIEVPPQSEDPDTEAPDSSDSETSDPVDYPNGLSTQTLLHDNLNREFILYIPDVYDGSSPVPVMLNFHGYGGYAENYMEWADMRPVADAENFILVYPQGTLLEGDPHWNASELGGDNKSDADDMGFTIALIASLAANLNIDTDRIYACGYSNGAFISYALACYRSDLIAAIGSVSGTMLEGTPEDCSPAHPTAMINLHGTSDDVVPYNGSGAYTPIADVMNYWAQANNIDGNPQINTTSSNGLTIEHYSYPTGNNDVSIAHYKIIGGDHVWFNINVNGANTGQLIWDFVSQYNKNGLIPQQ